MLSLTDHIQDVENVPRKCAEQAVSFFALHASWSTNGGSYPWNHIDKDWMVGAMHKLVRHVGEGRSLSDLGLENSIALDVDESIGGGAIYSSAGNSEEHTEDGQEYTDDQNDSEKKAPLLIDLDSPEPDMNNTPNENNRRTRSRPLRNSTPESPLRRRSLRTHAKPVLSTAAAAAPSSSPLSSLPSSLFGSGSSSSRSSGRGGDVNASTSTSGSGSSTSTSIRRKTRTSVARTARTSHAPAPAAPGPAGRRPSERHHHHHQHHHHPYGTRSQPQQQQQQKQQRNGATKKKKNPANTKTPAAAAATGGGGRGRGRTVRTDADTGETYDAWSFERILDSRRGAAAGADVEYRVKWTYHRPTWQPAVDLADNPDEIAAFHDKNPAKVGPPAWFARGRAGGGQLSGGS